ncbi:protein pbn1 [Sporothrix brasiliensis 5110]|uniref:Protein PBN1 n=1 Tax=Sporothrix brasiliensis 5110 TaxID=1398154 RepID=A0A0C2IS28_9PEZI|nr:protein pbn1 [Sporothrix brasiliensis 5110]KIH91841.1 protein pbn1 [Sporothrix brasiliensis 5110]
MRQRTTFFHRPESPVDPALLRVVDATLTGPTIEAAREDRVTLGLDELPAALARLLADNVHALHVRWAARTAGVELQSFNYLGDDRQTYQFYSDVADCTAFAAYVKADWCPSTADDGGLCSLQAEQLDGASALDLSYDTSSRTLKITTQWPLAMWPLYVAAQPGTTRTEVGIMGADMPSTLGPHELGMAGQVAVLGQDDRPKSVMFAFPSRHRTAAGGASYSATFTQPTGLHPTLQLRVAPGPPPHHHNPDDGKFGSCKLHTYLTLPRYIFADRYQLGDVLFLASKNLTALHHMTQPVDLEAPDYAVPVWGSAALIELAPPVGLTEEQQRSSEWTAEIPLHLRYLLPADGGYRSVEVPYPLVFWACEADKDVQFTTNPFDRVHVGYDGLFDETTEFWHLKPDPSLGAASSASSTDALTIPIRVPVLDSSKAQWVNVGTSAAILLGFSWVLWKLLSVYLRTGYGRTAHAKEAETKKTQ